MSLKRLVGTREFLTTLVTLSLQLWIQTGITLAYEKLSFRANVDLYELFSLHEKQKVLVSTSDVTPLISGQTGLLLSIP